MDCSLIDAAFPSTNLHELEKQNSQRDRNQMIESEQFTTLSVQAA
jgi:hypothetical protein